MKYIADYKRSKINYNDNISCGKSVTKMLIKNQIASGQEDEKDKWLDTKSAAKFLALSPNALRILVHRKQIEFYKLGNRLRFSLRALNDALVKQGD